MWRVSSRIVQLHSDALQVPMRRAACGSPGLTGSVGLLHAFVQVRILVARDEECAATNEDERHHC